MQLEPFIYLAAEAQLEYVATARYLDYFRQQYVWSGACYSEREPGSLFSSPILVYTYKWLNRRRYFYFWHLPIIFRLRSEVRPQLGDSSINSWLCHSIYIHEVSYRIMSYHRTRSFCASADSCSEGARHEQKITSLLKMSEWRMEN